MSMYYVTSYPKSGATWFRMLMYALFFDKVGNTREVQIFYPEVHNKEQVEKNLKSTDTSFIKSHHSYSPNLDYIDRAEAIIYLIRDPFNCMLSKIDHYKYEGVDWVNSDKGFNKFCKDFYQEANLSPDKTSDKLHGGWNHHVVSWNQSQISKPVYMVRYEDLISEPVKTISVLCRHLNFTFSNNKIKEAFEKTSFEKMRKLEEKELKNEIPGMFFSPKRKENFLSDDNLRFVKMGQKRDAILTLSIEQILTGKMTFFEGMQIGKYK